MSSLLLSVRWLAPVALASLLLTAPAVPSFADDDFCHGAAATIVGTDGDDVLLGTAGDDVIVGLGGDDVLRGRGGDDTLCGGPGDDLLAGGAGGDVIAGGAGVDTVSFAGAPGPVQVDLVDGVARGGFGVNLLESVENVIGTAGDDTLLGDAGDNALYGGPGDDLLSGREGDDLLSGGVGLDLAGYEDAAEGVVVVLREGRAQSASDTDQLSSVEGAIGSAFGDYLEGNGRGNHFDGGPGDDVLRGMGGPDSLVGGSGTDVANGGPAIDHCDVEAGRGCEPDDPGDTRNCSDFFVQAHAQVWFDAYFPTYGDVARLDADGNGIACESLPG